MIVCGKCGFTQPKDVYCANCGINLENYKPEKPPKLVQLLKDPYFQISFSIIVAIAAFFIFINKPSAPLTEDVIQTPEVEVTDSKADLTKGKVVKLSDEQLKSAKSPKAKAKVPSFKKQLKAIAKTKPKKNVIANKNESATTKELGQEESSSKATQAPLTPGGIKRATYSFYEVLPTQVETYFTSASKVEATVIVGSELDILNLPSTRLPIERDWNLTTSKKSQLDYMIESIQDGELKGIRFTLSQRGQNINVRVNANIPNKEGVASSIDWSRSLKVEKEKIILLKIQLPKNELPVSFLEANYNSPLSIMGSPQFLEQNSQLLVIIRFE